MATIDANGLAMQAGNQPSHLQSADADAFILGSELVNQNPFMLTEYFKQNGNEITTLSKVRLFFKGRFNNTRSSFSPYTGHWEKPRWNKTFAVGAIAAGPTANSAVVTLTAADMVTDTPEGTGQTYVRSRPRVGEVLQFVAGGKLYRINEKDKSVNPHTITIVSNDGSDPQDEIITGSVANIVSTVKAEGTGQIKSLIPRRFYYKNTFWITDDTDAVTGTNLTTTVRFQPVPGSNLLWMEGLRDMEKRNELNKGLVWLFGQQTTPNNWVQESELVEETINIPGTQGLIPFIQQSGFEINYDPNDVQIEDLYALSNYYHGINQPGGDILLIQGYNINQKFERALGEKLSYDWVIGVSDKYIQESVRRNWAESLDREYNPNGAFINLGLQGFALGQFTFLQTAAPEFNDNRGSGAIGYADWMLAVPFGETTVNDNDSIPYLGYEYRGSNGYNRENELWTTAGAGNRAITGRSDFYKTSPIDGVQFFVRSEIAPHFALGEQFAIYKPQGVSS